MEHYLLHLSYTTAGWDHILSTTPNFNQRMDPVRNLIAQLGGSFAAFHFHDRPPFIGIPRVDTLCTTSLPCSARTMLWQCSPCPIRMPHKPSPSHCRSSREFEYVHLSSMMPFEDAVTTSVNTSNAAIAATGYAGPGSPSP